MRSMVSRPVSFVSILSCMMLVAFVTSVTFVASGCKNASDKASTDPASTPAPSVADAAPSKPTANEGALRLGAPIEASAQNVSLADIAKNPGQYIGKTFATTGTVTAVCEHMGCWMEIKDASSEAHIKMAGHSFFVPKTASGRKARVLATLAKSDEEAACADDEGMSAAAAGTGKAGAAAKNEKAAKKTGCRAEAESQLGRPLAKLELVAQGVELM